MEKGETMFPNFQQIACVKLAIFFMYLSFANCLTLSSMYTHFNPLEKNSGKRGKR